MTTQVSPALLNLRPEVYNVASFGAVTDGGDISAPLKSALEAAAADGCRHVQVPHGRYYLGSKMDAILGATGAPVQRLSLSAPGAELIVPPSNTDGGIKITKADNFLRLAIEDLHLQSEAPIGTHGSATNGQAIELTSTLQPGDPGWGTTDIPELEMSSVSVSSTEPGATGRWSDGVKVDGFWFPRLNNVHVDTRHPSTDADQNYETGDGIALWHCFQAALTDCRSRGRFQHGMRIDETADFGYEDFAITQCYSEGAKDALTIRHESAGEQAEPLKEPGGQVVGGHFNGHRYAINIENRRQVNITSPLLYLTIGAGNSNYAGAAFLRLHNTHSGTYTGLRMPEGGHFNGTGDCARGVHFNGNSSYNIVTGSEFGHRGIAVANTSTGAGNIVMANAFESYSGAPDLKYVKSGTAADIRGDLGVYPVVS